MKFFFVCCNTNGSTKHDPLGFVQANSKREALKKLGLRLRRSGERRVVQEYYLPNHPDLPTISLEEAKEIYGGLAGLVKNRMQVDKILTSIYGKK